jgi:predicted NUDIX family NTP pyrophosphohydrolase
VGVRTSAGILLFRRGPAGLEVLLGHPGGPFFTRRDEGHWSIPKGEPDPVDATLDARQLLAVARREFEEETGLPAPESNVAPPIQLGSVVQKGGKVVHAWAIEGDLDPAGAVSNEFEMDWPPGSGRRQSFPEIDRVEWFRPAEARRRIKAPQAAFVDRLEAALAGHDVTGIHPESGAIAQTGTDQLGVRGASAERRAPHRKAPVSE